MNALIKALCAIDADMYVDNKQIYTKFLSILCGGDGNSMSSVTVAKVEDVFTYGANHKSDAANYAAAETMALQLSLQIQALEEMGYTMLFIRPSDILVLDRAGDNKFILANLSQRVPLYKKDKSCFLLDYPTVYPFPKEVCAPEVVAMAAIPFISPRSAAYYSLAVLCLNMLRMTLDDLQGTKLFYFLERCLKEKPTERQLLFFWILFLSCLNTFSNLYTFSIRIY